VSGPDRTAPRIAWSGASDDPRRLVNAVDAWFGMPSFSRLVRAFGGPRHPMSLPELESFAAEHWDFRGGLERNLARPATVTDDQAAALHRAAADLGMLAGLPTGRHYDTIIMTGGMVRAGIVKPRFTASLLSRGIAADRVVFLGAHRPFAGDEIELASALGVVGSDEADAMECGITRAFGGLGLVEREGSGTPGAPDAWSSARWLWGSTTIEVLVAPSTEPSLRRANTADTYRFWLQRSGARPGHRVLIVTTPIYVPYQGAVAVEHLGLGAGLSVETIGADAAAGDLGPHTQIFTPAHHLQELRSAISALRRLRAAATAAEPS
jgi:hypothetical protein